MTQISSKSIDNILSYRISADKDKYEYQCKMNDADNPIWLSEDYISKNARKILENYKQKAGLIPNLNGCQHIQNNHNDEENDKEFDMMDFTKFIALDFNESFGIKLEVGIEFNESEMETSEIAEISSPVKIKSENFEYGDVDVEDEIQKDNIESSNKNYLIDSNKSTDSCKEVDNSQVTKTLENNNDRNNYGKALESTRDKEFSDPHGDPVVRFFNDLPVASKIVIDNRDISKTQLPKISVDILKSISEKGYIDALQNYMLSDQRDVLKSIVQSKPSNMVIAAKNNFLELVFSFISLGVNINGMDQHSKTALMYACENENKELIDLLVNNGATMNTVKKNERSILYICCQENKPKSVKALLKLGADFTRIQLEPPLSLLEHSKKMKLNEITKITEKFLTSLKDTIKNSIISRIIGTSKIKITRYIPICVLSPIEFQEESIKYSFDFDVSQLNNHFTMCFFLTGIIIGSEMQCLYSESHRITSVLLNGEEQVSLINSTYKTVTAFSPLQSRNSLKITGENLKCRKTRLILIACTVDSIE